MHRLANVDYVTLSRPEVRNAFDEHLIAEMTAWAEHAAQDQTLRGVVISGAGPSFCAGADLAWMAKMAGYSREDNVRDARAAAAMFAAIDTLPIPVIAQIHGAALGGGAGLAAVADIAVAADDTTFGFTEVKLGLMPAVIAPYVLAKIGQSAARELFITGRRFDAAHARDIGLVHVIVPAGRTVRQDEQISDRAGQERSRGDERGESAASHDREPIDRGGRADYRGGDCRAAGVGRSAEDDEGVSEEMSRQSAVGSRQSSVGSRQSSVGSRQSQLSAALLAIACAQVLNQSSEHLCNFFCTYRGGPLLSSLRDVPSCVSDREMRSNFL